MPATGLAGGLLEVPRGWQGRQGQHPKESSRDGQGYEAF